MEGDINKLVSKLLLLNFVPTLGIIFKSGLSFLA